MSENSQDLVLAYCGLVCSDCGMYVKGRCQGCHGEKPMIKNCKIKQCCIGRQYSTCAGCEEFANLKECRKLHNLISRLFSFVFRTDRIGNLNRIRQVGRDQFEKEAAVAKGP
jgi:hypothetical protein